VLTKGIRHEMRQNQPHCKQIARFRRLDTGRTGTYHTWLLEPREEGTTYVVMEETGTGVNPRKLADSNPGHMHRGHEVWNISLKFLCESTQD
jgi:hypothetical protein